MTCLQNGLVICGLYLRIHLSVVYKKGFKKFIFQSKQSFCLRNIYWRWKKQEGFNLKWGDLYGKIMKNLIFDYCNSGSSKSSVLPQDSGGTILRWHDRSERRGMWLWNYPSMLGGKVPTTYTTQKLSCTQTHSLVWIYVDDIKW